MRKASTPKLPTSGFSSLSTLKQTKSFLKIIKCHHCLQSFVRFQEQQVDMAQCCLAEWVKPNCRNLVQCESIRLRATPAPILLCSFLSILSGKAHVCPSAQTPKTCAHGQRLSPFKGSFEFWWFSCLKYMYRSIFPLASEEKYYCH